MLSISRNGGTAATTSDPPNTLPVVGFPMAHFYFGGFGTTNAAFNIRSFTAYTAQADSVLPTLSGA